jgi:hypothetical protein
MKLKNTTPNKIYYATEYYTAGYKFFRTLILIWSIDKNDYAITVSYETLATEGIETAIFFIGMGINQEVTPVPIEDLPLYVHFSHKTQNFDRFIKGEPPIKPKSPELLCQKRPHEK